MRIKFLSIIASFFMVSFVITSCLDNDNNVEYSPDATIHAFELDTIGGYGVSYKFTIDQMRGLIYNEDSLPVKADTIVDRILITNLSTTSGIITIKTQDGKNDSLLNTSDSIDLTKYINQAQDKQLQLKVWAPDMQTSKQYYLGLRVHKHDPDSLKWQYKYNSPVPSSSLQKSILLNGKIITYYVTANSLYAFVHPNNAGAQITGNTFNSELPTSIIVYNKVAYATSSIKDGKVYQSTDGIDWTESSLFNGANVVTLLAPLNDKITYIVKANNGANYFTSTSEITPKANAETELQEVPEDFPTSNFAYTSYSTPTNIPAVMLVGDYAIGKQPKVGDTEVETIVPWAYMGGTWVALPPNNKDTSCPALKHPSIIYYNNQFYIFGDGFDSFYASMAGIAWKKANKKFSFPYYSDWGGSLSYSPEKTPEFRGRQIYSSIVDPKTAYIWVMFNAGPVSFKDAAGNERTYTPSTSEVWSGRLNQLWFDIANNKYTY